VKLNYQKPKHLGVLSNVEKTYVTDKETRWSTSGAIHTVEGTIVNWLSKMQQSVTLSSMEAEYVRLASGAWECKIL
jgi:hypothetical protein